MHRTLLVLTLVSTRALASADYPGEIQTKYGLSAPPLQSCGLCHTNGIPGSGTVNTPIGLALRSRMLVSGDPAALRAALDRLEMDMVDSDGDGVIDVQELRAGTNPTVAEGATDGGMGGGMGGGTGGGGGTVAALKYGCGASIVPEVVIVGGLLFLRRRLRR